MSATGYDLITEEMWREALDRIEALEAALEKSVKLQSHYAGLLNAYDGGRRLQFANADAWITRLAALDKDTGK